jgi:hypothetical protein
VSGQAKRCQPSKLLRTESECQQPKKNFEKEEEEEKRRKLIVYHMRHCVNHDHDLIFTQYLKIFTKQNRNTNSNLSITTKTKQSTKTNQGLSFYNDE